jgi:hypothetical protein
VFILRVQHSSHLYKNIYVIVDNTSTFQKTLITLRYLPPFPWFSSNITGLWHWKTGIISKVTCLFLPTFPFPPPLYCLPSFFPWEPWQGTCNDWLFYMLICMLYLPHFRGKEFCVTFCNSFGLCPQRALLWIAAYWQNHFEDVFCAFHQHMSIFALGYQSSVRIDHSL